MTQTINRISPFPHAARLDRLERLANDLDSKFRIPGTKIRFGWDPILGLLPVIGDIAALGPAGFILLQAHQMGASTPVKARMVANTGLDFVIGSIPLLGSVFDVGWRANRRNIALLREHLEQGTSARDPAA